MKMYLPRPIQRHKRFILISCVLTALLLAGCGKHEHEWMDATCTAPKTCAACGETEGEPLAHTFSAANYQTPATCSVCGETDGTVLIPYFVSHGIVVQPMTVNEPHTVELACYDNPSFVTVPTVTITDYSVFASDEIHESKEGYEWRKADFSVHFSDENTIYGVTVPHFVQDYYDDDLLSATAQILDDATCTFNTNYNGQEYECQSWREGSNSGWEGNEITFTYTITALVPTGYDGFVFGIHDIDLEELTENNANEYLFFRMT